jgi:hypothetical protein
MKRRLLFLGLAGLVASLAMGKPSQADSVTYISTVVPDQSIPFSVPLTLPLFNPSLGTLTGVTLSVDATITADIQVVNINTSPMAFTNATASVPVTATGPGGATATVTAMAVVPSGTAAPGLNDFPGVAGSTSGVNPVSPADFSLYIGTGTFTGTLSVVAPTGTFSGSGPPGLFFGGTATAGGSIDVTYTFTPAVPEPSSMALLGIGMVSLLSWRRVFKRYTAA